MTTHIIYNMALICHIIGLTMMAGSALSDYIMTRQFWKYYATDRTKGIGIQSAMTKFPIMARIGMLVLLISGFIMMICVKGAFASQIWFQVKMCLVVLVMINGIMVKKALSAKLTRNLAEAMIGNEDIIGLIRLRSSLNWFHFSQMSLFLIIYTLAVFKFN